MRPQALKRSERNVRIAAQVKKTKDHDHGWLDDLLGGSLSSFSSNLARWHDDVQRLAREHESPLLHVYMEHLIGPNQQVNITLAHEIFTFLGVEPMVTQQDLRRAERFREW